MKSNIDNAIIQQILHQSMIDGIQKIVVSAVIKHNNKFLLVERAPCDFLGGLITLPGGSMQENENLLQAIMREIKEETGLIITEVTSYLGSFDYASSSEKKVRQFNFLVKTKSGNIKLDPTEHCKYYFLNSSDKKFSTLNISSGTKKILSMAKKK